MLQNKPPKIVERSELPEELQNKNTLIKSLTSVMFSEDLLDMKKEDTPQIGRVLTGKEFENLQLDDSNPDGTDGLFQKNDNGIHKSELVPLSVDRKKEPQLRTNQNQVGEDQERAHEHSQDNLERETNEIGIGDDQL